LWRTSGQNRAELTEGEGKEDKFFRYETRSDKNNPTERRRFFNKKVSNSKKKKILGTGKSKTWVRRKSDRLSGFSGGKMKERRLKEKFF